MTRTDPVHQKPRTSSRRRGGFVPLVLAPLLLSWGSLGCGHSEREWQAQLGRYGDLGQQYQNQQAELERARAEVARLMGELQRQGLNLRSEQAKTGDLQQLLDEAKAQAALLERVKARFEALRDKLKELTELGLEVRIRHNKMVVSLPGDVLFAPGSAKLSRAGENVLSKVTKALLSDPALAERYYQVAGHTDNQPVVRTAEEFKDNWGLSLMRAREVLLFVTKVEAGRGLDIKRWSAAGYADTDPVAPNSTPEARRKNRRVELVVQPDVEEMLDLKSLVAE
ncbi:MAG: OmpA family protein [Polyangiaceae bacterium]|nr:OmpA family protein [Polyangiaceae bacterium]